jgi:hypothetical protein
LRAAGIKFRIDPSHVSEDSKQTQPRRLVVELARRKACAVASRHPLKPVLGADRQFETKLYQLYDGTLMLSGNTKLLWHGKEIDQKELQVIPSAKRKYPARISPSGAVRAFKYVVRTLPFYSRIQKLRKKFS